MTAQNGDKIETQRHSPVSHVTARSMLASASKINLTKSCKMQHSSFAKAEYICLDGTDSRHFLSSFLLLQKHKAV